MLIFQRLTPDEPVEPDQDRPIPNTNKQPNCLRARNGRVAFFWSSQPIRYYKTLRHGHYWGIPAGAKYWRFPIFKRKAAGWDYGQGPVFSLTSETIERR